MKNLVVLSAVILFSACTSINDIKENEFVSEIRSFPLRPLYLNTPDPDNRGKSIRYYGLKYERSF